MSEARMQSEADLERRILSRAWVIAAAFFPVVAVVNAASLLTDAERAGSGLDPRVPWILEFTSISVVLALVPLVSRLERWMPFTADNWRRALIAYALASPVFSALHVAGMVLLRNLIYPIVFGEEYSFFDDFFRDAFYEYRKDLTALAAILLVLTLVRGIEEQRRETQAAKSDARATGKLTLKSGGRTIFLNAQSFDWASAAGNYVEVRAGGQTHLARTSLTALAEQLAEAGIDIARIHRSAIVNRAKVKETAPLGDGDFQVRLAEGSELRGSRRYRQESRL
jgi:DNA-binding LytR/AlgR family response regulator